MLCDRDAGRANGLVRRPFFLFGEKSMANNEWLYSSDDDDQKGPVSAQELQRLAESGELRPDDLIWKEGMDEWLPASRLKGMTFSAPAPEPSASPPPRAFDKESLKSTFEDAQRKVDEAAGVLWFLDLKFNHFVSATIIRVVWSAYLALVALVLILGSIRAILDYPIIQAVLGFVGAIIGFAFITLMFRAWLEVLMVIFRMAEHLREMNEKLAAQEQ